MSPPTNHDSENPDAGTVAQPVEQREAIEKRVAVLKDLNFEPLRDVEAFHAKFGLLFSGDARNLPPELSGFRERFMQEELNEYILAARNAEAAIAVGNMDHYYSALADQQDALIDLIYVALGTAHLHGFKRFREGWRRVQEANMAKVRVENIADSTRGSAFDVVKPAGWQKPTHLDLVV